MLESKTPLVFRDAPKRRGRRSFDTIVSATEPAPFPIVLQRRARVAVRRHVLRGASRSTVLVACDVATLLALRFILHLVRDAEVLGQEPSRIAAALIPRGTFPPLQFLAAMGAGLLVRGAYGPGDLRRDGSRIMAATMLGLALIFWGRLWQGIDSSAIVGFGVAVLTIGGSLVVERYLIDRAVVRYRPASGDAPRTLLVGTPTDTEAAMDHPGLADSREFLVVSHLDAAAVPFGGVGDVTESLVTAIARDAIDTVVLCGYFEANALRELIDVSDAAGCHLFSLPRRTEFSGLEPQLVWRRGAPLVQLTRPGIRGQHLVAKRALDIIGASAGLVIAAPVLALVAIAVRLSSPGPVLFRQRRVGRGGRCFSILKFRSMVSDAESRRDAIGEHSIYSDPRLFKIVRDPRVTPLGDFLRRTSLDELPQLWNVLRGEMSLVGPRPPLPSEVKLYDARHYGRFYMKPGITGPWQVGGRNRITDFDTVVRIEAAYMWQWSIWKDLSILARTIPAVLKMRGAH